MIIDWQDLSQKCLPYARVRLATCKSVLGGFNLLVDRIKSLDASELEKLIREIGDVELKELFDPEALVITNCSAIRDQRGLVELLVKCVASGSSMEVPISSLEVFQWLNKRWEKSNELKVGGQAAYMAMAACALVPKVILLGYPIPTFFTEQILSLKNIYIAVLQNSDLCVKPVNDCTNIAGHDYMSWAIEFSAGLEVSMGDAKLKSPRAGRFIASWFPCDEWMSSGTSERLANSGIQVTHAFLSGCQMLYPDVDNKNRWRSQIKEFADAIDVLHNKIRCRAIHYEMGSTQSPLLLRAMIDNVLPRVDSVGCNEEELAAILKEVGEEKLVEEIRTGISPINVYEGALRLMQRFELRRLHVHTWDFHVSVSRPDAEGHEVERDALLFGTVMGAAKTYATMNIEDDHIEKGSEVSFSKNGRRLVEKLHEDPQVMGVCVGGGAFRTDDVLVCIVPGRIRDKLPSTVGMGDTLSSMAFLVATG